MQTSLPLQIFEAQQQRELEEYYAQPKEAQNAYLLRRITVEPVKSRGRSEFKGERSAAWKYNLLKDNQPVQVCREFFLCTYGLTRAKLETIREHMNDQENPTPSLAHKPATTISSAMIDVVKQHIESFPCVESHYCRASTQRQ